ncbi:hypothetical protein ACFE04_013620 [Oxalis oulophora]
MFLKFCGSITTLGFFRQQLKPKTPLINNNNNNNNPYYASILHIIIRRRFIHYDTNLIINPQFNLTPKTTQPNVAIFWDLDNKPPDTFPPYEAALKLKKAAFTFGNVIYLVAYANRHAFTWVPKAVREQRKDMLVKAAESYVCRVCGRRFYANDKFVNHFKQIHETEHNKRMNQIESARGTMRVKLVAKYAMKMEKYKNAARDVFVPPVGYGLADELKRAGFLVRTVPNKPQATDVAMRDHIREVMDKRKVDCLLLVSDDSDFVGVLKEAKVRCVMTVVVGDIGDGALKRVADAGFSWTEILKGKAKKDAVTVVSKWKDKDVLKRLEWEYDPDKEKGKYNLDDDFEGFSGNDEGIKSIIDSVDDVQNEAGRAWWKLDSDSDVPSSQSR